MSNRTAGLNSYLETIFVSEKFNWIIKMIDKWHSNATQVQITLILNNNSMLNLCTEGHCVNVYSPYWIIFIRHHSDATRDCVRDNNFFSFFIFIADARHNAIHATWEEYFQSQWIRSVVVVATATDTATATCVTRYRSIIYLFPSMCAVCMWMKCFCYCSSAFTKSSVEVVADCCINDGMQRRWNAIRDVSKRAQNIFKLHERTQIIHIYLHTINETTCTCI